MALNPPGIMNSNHRRDFSNPMIQIVLLVIVIVLLSWFVVKPKFASTMENRTELKAAKARMAKVEEDQQELNRLISAMKASPEEIALVDEALPLTGRVSKAYTLLNTLVQFSGMSLTLLGADDTSKVIAAGDKDELENPYKPGRKLHTVTMTVSVEGNMEQFKSLLELIETNGRVLDVETVNIIGGEEAPKYHVTVKAYAYENI
jgi:hypothetical protein